MELRTGSVELQRILLCGNSLHSRIKRQEKELHIIGESMSKV